MSASLLSLVSGGVGQLFGPLINRLVDLIPDPVAKAAALQEFQEKSMAADAAMEAAQNAINQVEAGNESVFVSGWRPFVGWVCGAGLAWQIFVGPIVGYLAQLCGSHAQMPVFDTGATTALLVPLLGLGAYRTYEKTTGAAGGAMTASQVRSTNLAIAKAHAGAAP